MYGYKYPSHQPTAQKTQIWNQHLCGGTQREYKMLCSRCVLPFLAFYLLLEEISAIALPSRNKRDTNWPDLDLMPRLPDRFEQGDLSAGDAGVTSRATQSETLPEHIPVQRQHQHQHQHQRKSNEKRRKIIPMDTIGNFQMSSLRNRKNEPEPDLHWDDPTD